MRKLIASMNLTLDGFMTGSDGGLDWHFACWNDEMARAASEHLAASDTIVLGRLTYTAMAGYWEQKMSVITGAREDISFADRMNRYHKVVFSRTLAGPGWQHTRLVRSGLGREIGRLKHQDGKNIIIYGSGSIVSALSRLRLIDEYILWIHPVILGRGKPLFQSSKDRTPLRLLKTVRFSSGVVIMHYGRVSPEGTHPDREA